MRWTQKISNKVEYISQVEKAKIYSNPEAKIALLAKRGNNFRNSVMSDLHGIKLSKKITEKTDERDQKNE